MFELTAYDVENLIDLTEIKMLATRRLCRGFGVPDIAARSRVQRSRLFLGLLSCCAAVFTVPLPARHMLRPVVIGPQYKHNRTG
jgi:hypothetical protein